MNNPKLDQNKVFIVSVMPYLFKNMGQCALEIIYTNGDTQMLTTKSTNPNHFENYDFETEQDMLNFYETIKK